MKQITIVLLLLAYIQVKAQKLSEWMYLNDTIYIELFNPTGNVVNKITIQRCDSIFEQPNTLVDDFNKEGAICIIKHPTYNKSIGCGSFSVKFDGQYSGGGQLSQCTKGYSISIIESEIVSKSKYPFLQLGGWNLYNGHKDIISFPSIGVQNVIDSSLMYIKGNLSEYDNKQEPYRNQLFWAFNLMADPETGDTILRTDSDGNFEAVSLAQRYGFQEILLIDSSEIGKYDRKTFKSSDDWHVAYNEGRVLFVDWGVGGLPGEREENIWRGMISPTEIVSISTLTLSPNPAKGSVAVDYELPADTDYRSCSIVLVGADGRVVRKEQLQSASDTKAVQLGGIARGQYSCIIRTDDGIVIGSENLIVE